jgi:hypothetical protein
MLLGPNVTKPIILKFSMMKEKHLRQNVILSKDGRTKDNGPNVSCSGKFFHRTKSNRKT